MCRHRRGTRETRTGRTDDKEHPSEQVTLLSVLQCVWTHCSWTGQQQQLLWQAGRRTGSLHTSASQLEGSRTDKVTPAAPFAVHTPCCNISTNLRPGRLLGENSWRLGVKGEVGRTTPTESFSFCSVFFLLTPREAAKAHNQVPARAYFYTAGSDRTSCITWRH